MLGYQEKIDYKYLFAIAKKFNCGLHPMFSFNTPENWFANFKFFIDHEFTPYLLEVRHPISVENTFKALNQLCLIKTYVNKYIKSKELRRRFNTTELSRTPRGLGCSAHTSLTIMPNGDIPFCHRVVDQPWVMANVLKKEISTDKLVTLVSGHHHSNHPECLTCPIKVYCSGNCAGASYEYWGDPWIPINSVCDYIRLKYYVFGNLFDSWEPFFKVVSKEQLEKSVFETFGKERVEQFIESQRKENDKI
jgi:radical SAM protein with 4Fe4S-binding SPASM domain